MTMWQRSAKRKAQLRAARSLIRVKRLEYSDPERIEQVYRTLALITLHLGEWDDVAVQRLIELKRERTKK